MNVSEWQTRLERTFGQEGLIGIRVLPIHDAENECARRFVEKFAGHRVLTDSFQDFYVDSLGLAAKWVRAHGLPDAYANYQYTVLTYVANFRRLRAAETLSLSGYPLDAFSLLRDLKDNALFLGAIVAGITSVPALWGWWEGSGEAELSDSERAKMTREQKRRENHVLGQMVGGESGLPDEVQRELKKWKDIFHYEVHGSRLTKASAWMNWSKGGRLSIGPTFDDFSSAMYMNRCAEVHWMLLRSLPFLQCASHAFGVEWAEKWRVLDDSFRFDIECLDGLGKPISSAFMALMEAKFPFSPASIYKEPEQTSQPT